MCIAFWLIACDSDSAPADIGAPACMPLLKFWARLSGPRACPTSGMPAPRPEEGIEGRLAPGEERPEVLGVDMDGIAPEVEAVPGVAPGTDPGSVPGLIPGID